MKENHIHTPFIILHANGHNVSKDFSPYVMSVSYTDYEKEQSDELNISLKDIENKFKNDWSVDKGTTLSCKIGFNDSAEMLDCGEFIVDEVTLNANSSTYDVVTIRALAATIKQPLRTAKTRAFNSKSLFQIVEQIADENKLQVTTLGQDVQIGHITQTKSTDLWFLRSLAQRFGFIFKLCSNRLFFLDEDEVKKGEEVFEFNRGNIAEINITDKSNKVYKKATVSYFDAKSKKVKRYTATSDKSTTSNDTLKSNVRCNSLESAKLQAKILLKNGQKSVTGSITPSKADVRLVAGVNIKVNEFGIYDGKYHVTSSTHTLSTSDYSVNMEIEKC